MKVSMDGAPYLRKMDLTIYKSYVELVKALENMFKFNLGKRKFSPVKFIIAHQLKFKLL